MIVRGADVAPTPWANGGGSTRELYVGELDGIRWRLSMALVDGTGEFSVLPGVARSLVLVSGDVRLSFGSSTLPGGPALTLPGDPHLTLPERAAGESRGWVPLREPITFDGATPVTYQAIEPSEDLGVMVWGPTPARLTVVDIDHPFRLVPDEHRAAVVLGGELQVDGVRLGVRDALIIEEPVRPRGGARVAIVGR